MDAPAPRARVASFHLVREPSALRATTRLATDRWRLARTPGLAFWRLLGTGAASDTGPGADLHRTALFAVWDDERSLERFAASMGPRWGASSETWHVRLRSHGGHGTWRGVDVLAGLEAATGSTDAVAIVTRADVRPAAWRAFGAAGRPVSDELRAAEGLLAVVGVGEAPVGRLGTFSLWRDLDAALGFHRSPRHLAVVRRTRAERWYREELFARFEPYASVGTWDGRDPLA